MCIRDSPRTSRRRSGGNRRRSISRAVRARRRPVLTSHTKALWWCPWNFTWRRALTARHCGHRGPRAS
eukprot:939572-Alexandrium_andersonii.AAC.1